MVVEITQKEWPEQPNIAPYIMAQMNQESGCNRRAQSPFAFGLMQITKPTAGDLEKGLCRDLGKAKLFDEEWSISCGVRYLKFLFGKMPEYWPFWQRMAAALSAYNGGRGWVNRDNRYCKRFTWCDPSKWFDHVENTPDPRRARWAIKENRGYVRRIQYKLLKRYL
jgi:membrane-bound lytic murein transglycosylase MltF